MSVRIGLFSFLCLHSLCSVFMAYMYVVLYVCIYLCNKLGSVLFIFVFVDSAHISLVGSVVSGLRPCMYLFNGLCLHIFVWEFLCRVDIKIKKSYTLQAHSIRFLPLPNPEHEPFHIIILLALHSLWRSRTAVRPSHKNVQPIYVYFIKIMFIIKTTFDSL